MMIFTSIWSLLCVTFISFIPDSIYIIDYMLSGFVIGSSSISLIVSIKHFNNKEYGVIGYRIKIIKSRLDSYWYAGSIGKEYWAYLDDNKRDYIIITEGIIYKDESGNLKQYKDYGKRCIVPEDCEVIRVSNIIVETSTTSKIIDTSVRDLHVDR